MSAEGEQAPAKRGIRPNVRAAGLAVVIAAAMSLAATAYPVFDPATQQRYLTSPDSVGIAQWAARSTWRDAIRWWYGPWIQRTGYYRPISSLAIWLEHKAFGGSFQAMCVVSWILHAVNGALLCVLAMRLFEGVDRAWLWALVAVALFNYRLGPAGPFWRPVPVAIGVVAWWPAQTDQLSLAASLLSLVLVDGYFRRPGRRRLMAALAWFAVALLSKEMAVCVPLVVLALGLYRRAGEVWKVAGVYAAMAAGLLIVRYFAVPGAMGPRLGELDPLFVVHKLALYTAERFMSYVHPRGAAEYWLVVAAGGTVGVVYALWRLRLSVVFMIVAGLVIPLLAAQYVGGNVALVTIPREFYGLVVSFVMVVGVIALVRLGTRLTWTLLGMVYAVHLPILHVIGPHYWYWPAAFWGLFSASLLSRVVEHTRQVLRQPPFVADGCRR